MPNIVTNNIYKSLNINTMKNNNLKITLQANAVFSSLSGLAMIFFHKALSSWMGIQNAQIMIFIGIGLLLFAGTIIWISLQKTIDQKHVKTIILQDWLWVIGSILIIVTQAFGLNIVAYVCIGVVALIVADFAILQRRYL